MKLILCIAGPTGSQKTDLALRLRKFLQSISRRAVEDLFAVKKDIAKEMETRSRNNFYPLKDASTFIGNESHQVVDMKSEDLNNGNESTMIHYSGIEELPHKSTVTVSPIISCDSVQIFKDFSILSNQESKDHIMTDFISFSDQYDVVKYVKTVKRFIDQSNFQIYLVVGGCVMYMERLCEELVGQSDKYFSDQLKKTRYDEYTGCFVSSNTKTMDSMKIIQSFGQHPSKDKKEVKFHSTEPGQLNENNEFTPSQFYDQDLTLAKNHNTYIINKFFLSVDRLVLYPKLDHRAERMIIEGGLLELITNCFKIDCFYMDSHNTSSGKSLMDMVPSCNDDSTITHTSSAKGLILHPKSYNKTLPIGCQEFYEFFRANPIVLYRHCCSNHEIFSLSPKKEQRKDETSDYKVPEMSRGESIYKFFESFDNHNMTDQMGLYPTDARVLNQNEFYQAFIETLKIFKRNTRNYVRRQETYIKKRDYIHITNIELSARVEEIMNKTMVGGKHTQYQKKEEYFRKLKTWESEINLTVEDFSKLMRNIMDTHTVSHPP